MRITVRRGRHHLSLWQPWCLLRKELPSARCQLLCNELWEMNYAMTIWQKLYKQNGQTEAMAVFIVGQMPGSTLSQKIPLACSGAGRCLFLPQKLIPLPTDTRRSSFRCHYFILKQNSQSRGWPTLWSLFNRARPVKKQSFWIAKKSNSELHVFTSSASNTQQQNTQVQTSTDPQTFRGQEFLPECYAPCCPG